LHRKQGEQDEDGQRNHKALESRRYHLKSFNRRQYRQRWRDHRIAIKQRGADHAEQDDGEAFSSERAMRESHQGKRSAFAVIIGAEQDDHVFHRDDEEQRPDDEREDAEDRLPSGRCIVASRRQYRLAKGIKRARADVAIDDADRAEHERQELPTRRGL
jgi:hypothetical protein